MTAPCLKLSPLLLLAACATTPSAGRASAPRPETVAARAAVTAPPSGVATESMQEPSSVSPARAAQRVPNASNELALQARTEREQVEYQAAQLCRANAQYEQFLARAGNAPEYQLAAQRSREHIADNRAIIAWLLPERANVPCP